MSDNLRQSRLLADLPFDVLLKIFSECDVDDVLNLSATCKRLNEASEEHQTWLNQVTRFQIPIPTGLVPSRAELKDWAVLWLRSDERWVKPREEEDDDRSLNLHWFNMRPEKDHDAEVTPFVMANLIPGGKFVVVLYTDGQIDLKEIRIESEDKWDLQDVAQYKQDDPEGFHTMFWSQVLTETNLGCPLIAYVDDDHENGPSLWVFLVDHVDGIIEQKQLVTLDEIYFSDVYGIRARGNIILCLYEHSPGWGVAVAELGPAPTPKLFTLDTNRSPQPGANQFFMVSENAVVICDIEGIRLYHIPDLSSGEGPSTLNSVWEWLGESKWLCGSVDVTSSQHPMLYLQGTLGTHTITFRMNASGRDPVVTEHRISGGLPAYIASLEGEGGRRFVMKGRKGLGYPGFNTCLLGREELAGGFSVDVELPEDSIWNEHEVTLADFDERTGRILIGTNRYGAVNEDQAIRIYLADLPP